METGDVYWGGRGALRLDNLTDGLCPMLAVKRQLIAGLEITFPFLRVIPVIIIAEYLILLLFLLFS